MNKLIISIVAVSVLIGLTFADTFGNWRSEPSGSSQTLTITPGKNGEKLTVDKKSKVTFYEENGEGELVPLDPQPAYKMTPTKGTPGEKIEISSTGSDTSENFPPGTIVVIEQLDSTGGSNPKGAWSN